MTLGARVMCSATKSAFAGIRSRYIELTAATAGGLIQTLRKPNALAVSAKPSKWGKLLTLVATNKTKIAQQDRCD